MRRIFPYIVLPLFLLSGCSLRDEGYTQDMAEAEIGPYVRRFLREARNYGKNYDSIPLSYTFDDLDGDKAGVCDMMSHDPVRVRFDYEYWQTLEGPNADNMKENLVFHELGHGLCRRYHDNTVLNYGDWKTIMCGDELPNGRGPSINYRGMRKEYYRRELFTYTKEVPSWSTYVPNFDHIAYRQIFPHSTRDSAVSYKTLFEKNKFDNLECTITDNVCTARETEGKDAFVGIRFSDWSSDEDFFIESNISFWGKGEYGLMVGHLNDADSSYSVNAHYMMLDGAGHVNIGEMTCKYSFIELYEEINDPASVKLGLRRHGDTLFYYVDDKFIYYNDLVGLPCGGGYLLFQIPARGTLSMTSLTISVPAGSRRRNESLGALPLDSVCLPPLHYPSCWQK